MIVSIITERDIQDFVTGRASVETASAVFDYLKDHPVMAQQVGDLIKQRLEAMEAAAPRSALEPTPAFRFTEPFASHDPTFQ